MPTTGLRIRERRASDLPALVDALLLQQPETRYPLRDPLPFPVAEFLHDQDAAAAWTAELDGEVAGHVCRVASVRDVEDTRVLEQVCAAAHGCSPEDLTWVSALFVATTARRRGLGRLLQQTVVDDARAQGLHPCLEVLPVHPAALAMYVETGWRTVHHHRPGWLRATVGDEGPDVQVMVLTTPSHP